MQTKVVKTSNTSKFDEKGIFNNPLLSEDDFERGYTYDPEIINNIDRYEYSDHWFCKNKNCELKGDKFFMMKHPCKNNKE